VAAALAVIEPLDERIGPLEQALAPLARADRRVLLLDTIPGIGSLLALTIAAVARFPAPRKLIGYAGLAARVKHSRERSRAGERSKTGSRTLPLRRRRGRPGRLARVEPLGSPLLGHQGAHRHGEPGQGRRRPQGR